MGFYSLSGLGHGFGPRVRPHDDASYYSINELNASGDILSVPWMLGNTFTAKMR